MALEQFFKENSKLALAFSGGVDSSYLLYAGKKFGADIKPYFIKSVFQPEFEIDDAKRLAEFTNADLTIIEADVLLNQDVVKNDSNRCYYCKNALFNLLKKTSQSDGYNLIIDGTNASDDASDRPGMKALMELKVRSPLRECNITKQEIRNLSKEAGLFTWNKPSYACLATRVPTNTAITYEMLKKVENAENILFDMGFSDFRVRLLGNSAKIQLPKEQFALLISKHNQIIEKFSDFQDVLLDLKSR